MCHPARLLLFVILAAPTAGDSVQNPPPDQGEIYVATYSIAAFDPEAGEIGVAVTSRVPCVGNTAPHVRAGLGVVVTQASVRAGLGEEILDLMEGGLGPVDALDAALSTDSGRSGRQIGIIAADGRSAQYTGEGTVPWAGHGSSGDYIVQGNMLVGPDVLRAVAERFESTERTGRDLADRLIEALSAGEAYGGDLRRGVRQSAAVIVADARASGPGSARENSVEMGVCEHDRPIVELARVYRSVNENLGYRPMQQFYGRDVIQLKEILHALGYYRPWEPELRLDIGSAAYDQETVAAVNAFREAEGLSVLWSGTPPGLVDDETVERLWAALERKGIADEMRRRFRSERR